MPLLTSRTRQQINLGVSIMATTSTLLATDNQQPPSPNLYEKAVAVLRERYFDKAFSESRLDELAQQVPPPVPPPP